ncbi:sulfatase [Bacteroides sp. 51]|uniref:sulfatase family protein n=1 Tax=Bacteroides sp. 51 TaxID=2302938 RepID=UPI0013D24018|nr:sulfatase [Bacteroides sp. 51]NDV81743.1 heparan N-sulfatase [Bacteroides sp. 51]
MNKFFSRHLGLSLLMLPTLSWAQEKPNIVVIMADDLGTCELGCYGGQNVQTPNIDRLASEGIRLTNNYASAAMSVPIRASLYTGLYPARHGSYQNHKNSFKNIKSVTHYLPEAGYRVGRAGKRHTRPLSVYQFEEIPGFEVNCVSTTADFTTDGIEEYMTRDNQPFCLYVCSIHPHAPWTWGNADKFDPDKVILPPNCVDNRQTRELFATYLAEIEALDIEVGAVLQSLEKTGKLDNTLIIFLGEQGPQFPYGKWTSYRYGQNSAFIARYPDKIKAGTTSDALVQYEDVLPTLMEFAGGDEIVGIDGKSCLQVLFGKKKEHREWSYGIHNNIPEGTAYPIRSIQDKRYKLIVNLTSETDYFEKHMMNLENPRSVWPSWVKSAETDTDARDNVNRFVKRPAIEFYDLQKDPWELHNLAHEKKHVKRIAHMRTELGSWMNQQGDKGIAMDVEFKNK